MSLYRKFVSTTLCAAFAASLTAAIAAGADDDKCRRDIHNAEEKLEKAVHKHGEHSKQAEQRRHQLEEARERCKMHDHDHDHDHH